MRPDLDLEQTTWFFSQAIFEQLDEAIKKAYAADDLKLKDMREWGEVAYRIGIIRERLLAYYKDCIRLDVVEDVVEEMDKHIVTHGLPPDSQVMDKVEVIAKAAFRQAYGYHSKQNSGKDSGRAAG